jgi:hypothetical protein
MPMVRYDESKTIPRGLVSLSSYAVQMSFKDGSEGKYKWSENAAASSAGTGSVAKYTQKLLIVRHPFAESHYPMARQSSKSIHQLAHSSSFRSRGLVMAPSGRQFQLIVPAC